MQLHSSIQAIKNDPLKVFSRGASFLYGKLLATQDNVHLGNHLKLDGIPLIDIRDGGVLVIADNVTLTSRNRGYHLNLHSPVKLFADRSGAKISIGKHTRIHGSCIHAYSSITIGERCLVAANCQIMDGSGHDLSFDNVENRINTTGVTKDVVIEDDVWLGTGVVVLPGVRIGKGTVVGAGSVVSKNLPCNCLAVGVPARVVRNPEMVRL
jgi:acetyltransferase-like isoleucine patch superfamily enzyme